jgi:hypothetical protein
MSFGNKYDIIRENINKLEGAYKRNYMPLNLNESFAHINKKFEIAMAIHRLGYDIICEPRFRGHLGRPDIYIPYLDIAVEIIDSEKELKASKIANYPVKKIVPINANEIIQDISKKL